MKTIRLLFFLLPVMFVTVAFAQTDTSFVNHADKAIARQPPIEKVYLHLDKPAYDFADKGFTRSRAFYSPKYSASTPLPDARTTVYWNPNIITNIDGRATFEYLSNDAKATTVWQ